MKAVFADTAYWIGLINHQDSLHGRASDLSEALGDTHIVTSELVFVELLNSLSKKPHLRQWSSVAVEGLLVNPFVTVVLTTPELFQAALKLYKNSIDKQWSFVDCASFEIMKSKNLLEALTSDHHFEQAGFIALLRMD